MSTSKNFEISLIKQIELLAAKTPGVISLGQGTPSFDTPEPIKERAIAAIRSGQVAKYSLTYGLPELRQRIAVALATDGMEYDWENEILITVGAAEALSATFLSLLSPEKNEVILASPSYASYQQMIRLAGGKPIFTNLLEDENWKLNLDECRNLITPHTRALLLANPNNPTGTVCSKEELLALATLAREHDFLIIVDEVYRDFLYESDQSMFTLASLPEFRDLVIRVFSFSKAYAMTGWRVAFLHADVSIVNQIVKAHDSLVTCAPVVSQYAALAALDLAPDQTHAFRENYRRRRGYMCARLDKLSNIFSYQIPPAAYFVFPKTPSFPDSWALSRTLVESARVAVVPGVAFGPSGEGHLRFCFGKADEEIAEAFDRLDRYFAKNS